MQLKHVTVFTGDCTVAYRGLTRRRGSSFVLHLLFFEATRFVNLPLCTVPFFSANNNSDCGTKQKHPTTIVYTVNWTLYLCLAVSLAFSQSINFVTALILPLEKPLVAEDLLSFHSTSPNPLYEFNRTITHFSNE